MHIGFTNIVNAIKVTHRTHLALSPIDDGKRTMQDTGVTI